VSESNFKIGEYLAKLQARTCMSRALSSSFSSLLARRTTLLVITLPLIFTDLKKNQSHIRNKPFLILLLKTPPHLEYAATLHRIMAMSLWLRLFLVHSVDAKIKVKGRLVQRYSRNKRTDGRTLDRFMTLTAYYADRLIKSPVVYHVEQIPKVIWERATLSPHTRLCIHTVPACCNGSVLQLRAKRLSQTDRGTIHALYCTN